MNQTDKTQKAIQRLTVQSFAIKGFSFTFVGLIGNILKDTSNYFLLSISVIAVLVFWYLDTHYLRMERIYRTVENEYTDENDLDYKKYNINESYFWVAFSRTIFPIYIVQLLFVIILSLTTNGVI